MLKATFCAKEQNSWPQERQEPVRGSLKGVQFCIDRSFVEKYQAPGVKQPLLAYPAPPGPSHVDPLALCRLQAFF